MRWLCVFFRVLMVSFTRESVMSWLTKHSSTNFGVYFTNVYILQFYHAEVLNSWILLTLALGVCGFLLHVMLRGVGQVYLWMRHVERWVRGKLRPSLEAIKV